MSIDNPPAITLDATLLAFEEAVRVGKTSPELRAAVAAYGEVMRSLMKSIDRAEDEREKDTLTTIAWWVDLQGEARVRREMERAT